MVGSVVEDGGDEFGELPVVEPGGEVGETLAFTNRRDTDERDVEDDASATSGPAGSSTDA